MVVVMFRTLRTKKKKITGGYLFRTTHYGGGVFDGSGLFCFLKMMNQVTRALISAKIKNEKIKKNKKLKDKKIKRRQLIR